MDPKLSTDWQLIISGVAIGVGMTLAQRVSAPALFGFERGSDGFNAILLTWWLLGGLAAVAGIVIHALDAHHRRPKKPGVVRVECVSRCWLLPSPAVVNAARTSLCTPPALPSRVRILHLPPPARTPADQRGRLKRGASCAGRRGRRWLWGRDVGVADRGHAEQPPRPLAARARLLAHRPSVLAMHSAPSRSKRVHRARGKARSQRPRVT